MTDQVWPAGRPGILDCGSDCELAILSALTDAYRCMRAIHYLLRDSGECGACGAAAGTSRAAVSGGWPCALPPGLDSGDDFAWLAVACRALEAWLLDVDWAMQRAASQQGPKRQLLETAGWWMTRCSQDALHVAALAMGAAGGLWARDAALRVVRATCVELNDAIITLG